MPLQLLRGAPQHLRHPQVDFPNNSVLRQKDSDDGVVEKGVLQILRVEVVEPPGDIQGQLRQESFEIFMERIDFGVKEDEQSPQVTVAAEGKNGAGFEAEAPVTFPPRVKDGIGHGIVNEQRFPLPPDLGHGTPAFRIPGIEGNPQIIQKGGRPGSNREPEPSRGIRPRDHRQVEMGIADGQLAEIPQQPLLIGDGGNGLVGLRQQGVEIREPLQALDMISQDTAHGPPFALRWVMKPRIQSDPAAPVAPAEARKSDIRCRINVFCSSKFLQSVDRVRG